MEAVAREVQLFNGENVDGFTGKRRQLKRLLVVPMVAVKEVVGGVNVGNE